LFEAGKCVEVQTPICREEGHTMAAFPDMLGYEGEGEVGNTLNLFKVKTSNEVTKL
jgi:hypothetical protein